MENGLLYFHQGYSDIINCLSLVNYYAEKYTSLKVLMRDDFRETFDFYIKGLNNVEGLYLPKSQLDRNNFSSISNLSIDHDILFHGYSDFYRRDKFRGSFHSNIFNVKGFYTIYGIDYINKINYFSFERNLESEDEFYKKIIGEEKDYIVYHENDDNKVNIDKINYKCVDLNGISNNIFETIKVLEMSKEIHIVDSIWAAFCYLLDCKYQIFQNKKIYLYPFYNRSGSCLAGPDCERFTNSKYSQSLDPIHPENWTIIKY